MARNYKTISRIHFPNDKDINEFDTISKENLSPEQQKKLLGILEAFALLPTIIPDSRTTQITEKKGEVAKQLTSLLRSTTRTVRHKIRHKP